LKGQGVKKSKKKAKHWLLKAKLNGNMNASELLDML
jgi:TPR repeat protein